MKLIKINTEHYIIVDDSEINEGDWVYSFDNKLILQANKGSTNTINSKSFNGKGFAKITHSTQILGFLNESGITTANLKPDWNNVKQLPLSEVKELIGEVDYSGENLLWLAGYEKCLEDNKDRKYTEEDLRKAINMARKRDDWGEWEIHDQNIIQSLQPKTEWEVKFDENGKLKLV